MKDSVLRLLLLTWAFRDGCSSHFRYDLSVLRRVICIPSDLVQISIWFKLSRGACEPLVGVVFCS